MPFDTVGTPALWGAFIGFVLVVLALDLGVWNRTPHVVAPKEALGWSAVWVTLALAFGGLVWVRFGSEHGLEFLTGYLIEKSLSIDNIFVFIVIFSAFKVPPQYQHRILFWGILFALVLRAAMIFAGAALLTRFHWLIYVFGAFLVFTGVKLLRDRGEEAHPERGWFVRVVRRFIPLTTQLDGGRFTTMENGRRVATPLFLALVLVETTDVVFALDSIPAIFAVTLDPFIVFTSNIFAILGLRSLFFLLGAAVQKFEHLTVGLAAVLIFVGTKMAIVDFVKIPALVSLGVVAGLLGASVVYSAWKSRQASPPEADPHLPY